MFLGSNTKMWPCTSSWSRFDIFAESIYVLWLPQVSCAAC